MSYKRIDHRPLTESRFQKGDVVNINGQSGIVRIPNGPEGTIGVIIKENMIMFDEDEAMPTLGDKGYAPDFDLDRMMQLAGQPPGGKSEPEPAPSYVVSQDDMSDVAPQLDVAVDYEDDGMDAAPVPAPMETDQLSNSLAVVEKMIASCTAIELPDILKRLRAITVYAENMRLGLVSEGRKSLKNYMAENDVQTIGTDRNRAIDSINARMGGTPADKTKAAKVLDKMRSTGKVKQAGSTFTSEPMDDEDFAAAVAEVK